METDSNCQFLCCKCACFDFHDLDVRVPSSKHRLGIDRADLFALFCLLFQWDRTLHNNEVVT